METVPPPEILVSAYGDRYARAVRDVLGIEGGYVNDPVDNGGATKYGISLRFLVAEGKIDTDGDGIADFDLDMDGDIDGRDIRRLTRGDAIWLYYECFWKRYDCEFYPEPLGEAMFDQAVNGGARAANTLLQRALNRVHPTDRLHVDGKVGPATRARLLKVLDERWIGVLMDAYRHEAKQRYHAIVANNPSQRRFLNGWLARAERLGRYS